MGDAPIEESSEKPPLLKRVIRFVVSTVYILGNTDGFPAYGADAARDPFTGCMGVPLFDARDSLSSHRSRPIHFNS